MSNTSLVVPVILSLIIVYFAFVGIDHERERLSQAMSSLADKQTETRRSLPSGVHVMVTLKAPQEKSLKGVRDRAILATLLYHALCREELCKLTVNDFRHERQGVQHLRVSGKGEKTRHVPLHGIAKDLIEDYLKLAGHHAGALFRPLRDSRGGDRKKAITPDGVYKLVRTYSALLGFEIGAHALRATAATNALDHNADIAKVQQWLGHSNIATTRLYDRRRTRPEDSPTFKVSY